MSVIKAIFYTLMSVYPAFFSSCSCVFIRIHTFNTRNCSCINLYMEGRIYSICIFQSIVSCIRILLVPCSFLQLAEVLSKISSMYCRASSTPTRQDYQFPCDSMLLDSKCTLLDMLHALCVQLKLL